MASEIRMDSIGSPLDGGTSGARVEKEKTTAEVVAGGSTMEVIGGAGAIVLTIIGLAGVYPLWMAGISAIAIGGALMLRGFALTARYYALLDETGRTDAEAAELGSGIGAEVLGGAAAIVLGILVLLNIEPLILLPVSALVLGGTLLLGCGSNARLNDLIVERPYFAQRSNGRRIAADILAAANGAQALVALAAIVLGIVALVNPYHVTLSLVALLAVGSSILLSGGTVTGKMMTLMHRTTYGRRFGHI